VPALPLRSPGSVLVPPPETLFFSALAPAPALTTAGADTDADPDSEGAGVGVWSEAAVWRDAPPRSPAAAAKALAAAVAAVTGPQQQQHQQQQQHLLLTAQASVRARQQQGLLSVTQAALSARPPPAGTPAAAVREGEGVTGPLVNSDSAALRPRVFPGLQSGAPAQPRRPVVVRALGRPANADAQAVAPGAGSTVGGCTGRGQETVLRTALGGGLAAGSGASSALENGLDAVD